MQAPPQDEISDIGDPLPPWFLSAMKVPREDQQVQLEEKSLRYFRWGKPDNPPVIMLHGFLSHRRCWAFVAPLLADKYNLYAVDFSGMGDSTSSINDYTLQSRMDEVEGFIKAHNFSDKVFLVAHSYGGGVAMHSAKERLSPLLKGLIVCDTLMPAPEHAQPFIQNSRSMAASKSPKQKIYPDWQTIYSRFRLSPEQPCANPFLFEYMAKHSAKKIDKGWTWKFNPAIFARDDEEIFWWMENANSFCDITLPKAIIYGEKSALFPQGTKQYLRERSKTPFSIIEIKAAHHHVMLDQPIALASAIDATLSAWQSAQ